MNSAQDKRPQWPRPEWLSEWSDYPHGSLDEKRSREVVWYAIELEAQRRMALDTLIAVQNVFGNQNRPETLRRVHAAIAQLRKP